MSDRKDAGGQRATEATRARLDTSPTIVGLDALVSPPLAEGTVVAGRYRVESLLGVGGMGAVYRAHDQLLDLTVALKVLRREIAGDESFLQRFRQELIVARRVTHRHVVRIHDLGEHEGMPFMTMDYIPGRSLRQVLLAEGALPVPRTLEIVRQVAEALGEAHRQEVVHRDLKPGNVLLDERGDAYVTDFGVARSLSAPGLTRTGEVLGTPDYLAPEQARGERVDGRCDLYALGLIWFEMLSGDRPYTGGSLIEVLAQHMSGRTRTLREVGVAVPPAIDAVLRRCLASDPDDRYPDAKALLADLGDLTRPARRRWLRRLEAAAAAALVPVALLLLWRELAPQGTAAGVAEEGEAAATPAEVPGAHAVAFLPFAADGASADLALAASGIHALLAGAVAESPAVRVVDPARVAQTLADLGFDPQRLDGSGLARLADLLQADRLVTGSVRASGDRVELAVTLHEIVAGSPLPHPLRPLAGSAGELYGLAEGVAPDLLRRLEVPAASAERALSRSADAKTAYYEGLSLLGRGETLGALPPLERAVGLDPAFTAAWVELSRALQRLGRMDEALAAAQRATASAGAAAGRSALEARAQEALLRQQPEAAQRALAALVESYPNDLQARVGLAEAYATQGRFADAIATLQEVVRRDRSDPRAWYLLGRTAVQAGDVKNAVDEYLTQALLLQNRLGNREGQAEVLNALGVAYARLGNTPEAVRSYRDAAEIRRAVGDRRGLAVTEHNLGILLLQQGDFAGAEAALAEALATHRELGNRAGEAKLENAFGVLEEERGDPTAALARYQEALRIREALGDEADLAESYANVGFARLLLGAYGDARVYLERAAATFEKHGNEAGALPVRQSLGACELAQGRWRDALATLHATLERARELDLRAELAVAHGSLGALAHLEGRSGAALASYGEAAGLVAQLGHRRGEAEYALAAAEVLLDLGAAEEAASRLAGVAAWRGDGLGSEHGALLRRLEARLLAARGDAGAGRAFAEAVRAAEGTRLPPLALTARLAAAEAAGEPDRRRLAAMLADARAMGHAALELRAGEALARAELRAGDPGAAVAVLEPTLRRARGAGSWARSWALHALLAEARRAQGDSAGAAQQQALAEAEARRVAQEAPPRLRAALAQVPGLGPLLADQP